MFAKVKEEICEVLADNLGQSPEKILSLFEVPKTIDHGHLAVPVFFLAKELRKAPAVIAQEKAAQLQELGLAGIEKIQAAGGYINFYFKNSYLQSLLTETLQQPHLGHTHKGRGKKIVIDYCSPNVAKPLHVGHLRACMIGRAIYNLGLTQGYEVIGLNHLGDWGVQFGKLAWAYQKWGSEYPFEEEPFESLYKLYVRFHSEAEQNPEYDKEGSLVFKKLEEGDQEIQKLWQKFVEISLEKTQELLDVLGIRHELVRGESFYNDRLKPVEKELEEKGLLVESDGAMVVEMDGDMPPCLIRKADGASLYATRDIASAFYRVDELNADLSLYVVGNEQTLHFQQVFQVLEKMGHSSHAEKSHHISFGLYKIKDAPKMSARKGNVITLESIITKSIESVVQIIDEKNPNLKDKEKVAEQVGVGAIVFNDLVNDRVKGVDFDLDRALDFNGDSGPYVQYCAVRCKSILSKYGKESPSSFACELQTSEERQLIKRILMFSDILQSSFESFKPNILAHYLLDLCADFSHFYHKCRVLGEGSDIESSRVFLVKATCEVLVKGLATLNIQTPEQM